MRVYQFHHPRVWKKTYLFVAGASAFVSVFTGAFPASGAGLAAGAVAGGGSFPMTLDVCSFIRARVSKKLVTRNRTAQAVVVFVKKFEAPLLPKMLWLELPKPIPASPFPGCRRITQTRNTQMKM